MDNPISGSTGGATTAPAATGNKLSSPVDILKKAIDIYSLGFKKFIGMMLIPLVAMVPLLLVIGLSFIVSMILADGPVQSVVKLVITLIGILAVLALIYLGVVSQVGVMRLLRVDLNTARVLDVFNTSRPYFWRFFGLNLLYGLAVFAGAILLVIPGVIIAVVYGFSFLALVLEDLGITESMKRSRDLISGQFWPVLGRGLFLALVWILMMIVIGLPAAGARDNSIMEVIWNIFSQAVQFAVSPLYLIYLYLIYKELAGFKAPVSPAANPAPGASI